MKVNVYQLGYTNRTDFENHDNDKLELRSMGYVELQEGEYNQKYWADDVWHLLNWGCWNHDEDGNAVKPAGVNSKLDHCNSDIILNADGTDDYRYAKSVGWGEAGSLEEAAEKMKKDFCFFWMF